MRGFTFESNFLCRKNVTSTLGTVHLLAHQKFP
eukprot:UN23686